MPTPQPPEDAVEHGGHLTVAVPKVHHFLRLYVSLSIGCSLPSLSMIDMLKILVSSSFSSVVDLNLAGLPSGPGPSPVMVSTLLSLSKSPSIVMGAVDNESAHMVRYFFVAGS